MTDSQPDDRFRAEAAALEDAYLLGTEEMERSGFDGGPARWEAERRPLSEAISHDGTFLDVGCANGFLAASVVDWVAERGVSLIPFGVDLGKHLIAEARVIHPSNAANFVFGDAWNWAPGRRFTYVYSLLDLSPDDLLSSWVSRLLSWVEPDGRLILGSYGSQSRSIEPADVSAALATAGHMPLGTSAGGIGPVTRFSWTGHISA